MSINVAGIVHESRDGSGASHDLARQADLGRFPTMMLSTSVALRSALAWHRATVGGTRRHAAPGLARAEDGAGFGPDESAHPGPISGLSRRLRRCASARW